VTATPATAAPAQAGAQRLPLARVVPGRAKTLDPGLALHASVEVRRDGGSDAMRFPRPACRRTVSPV